MSRALSGRPLGRRPGDPDATRSAILDAARRHFAEHGFDRTTIRAVAEAADVDPALVIHHFRTKQGLFVAAHRMPFDPAALVKSVEALPPEERGEALARTLLTAFDAKDSPVFSLVRTTATNDDAAAMLREFIHATVLRRGVSLVGGADAELRLALIASHIVGIVFARRIVKVRPLARARLDDVVAAVAPTIQRYLDGS